MNLALQTLSAIAIALVVVSVLLLGTLIVAPWRAVRGEPPLDDEVETRLLLGEDPTEIAEDEDEAKAAEGRERADTVVKLDREGRSSA